MLQEAVDKRYYDELIPIAGADAIAWSRRARRRRRHLHRHLGRRPRLAVAVQVVLERAPAGSVLCCMLPDTGERYLSTPLFEGVANEMTPEEEALSALDPELPDDRRMIDAKVGTPRGGFSPAPRQGVTMKLTGVAMAV